MLFRSSIVLWLTAVVSRYFVKNPQTFVTSYPLLRGRRYLPIELRAESRKSFTSPEIVDELSSIIDEYTDLTFGHDTDTDHVVSLIQRYNDLLRQVEQKPTCPIFPKPFGHGDREVELIPTDNTSRPLSPKKQKNDKEKSDKVDKGDDSTEKPSSPTPSDSDDKGGCGFDDESDDSDDKGGCGFDDEDRKSTRLNSSH